MLSRKRRFAYAVVQPGELEMHVTVFRQQRDGSLQIGSCLRVITRFKIESAKVPQPDGMIRFSFDDLLKQLDRTRILPL